MLASYGSGGCTLHTGLLDRFNSWLLRMLRAYYESVIYTDLQSGVLNPLTKNGKLGLLKGNVSGKRNADGI